MNTHNGQEQVAEWMRQFGQQTPESPTDPDQKTCGLRSKLSLEETLEGIFHGFGIRFLLCPSLGMQIDFKLILEALKKSDAEFVQTQSPDLQAILDAGADKLVVTLGDFAACGLKAEPAFNEVMRSNASKMWTTTEVGPCCENLPEGFTATLAAEKVDEDTRCWVVRDGSGKVIKSPSYSPANLAPMVAGAGT